MEGSLENWLKLEMPKRLAEVKRRWLIPKSVVRWSRRDRLDRQLREEWAWNNPRLGRVPNAVVLDEYVRTYGQMCRQFKMEWPNEVEWRKRQQSFEKELDQRAKKQLHWFINIEKRREEAQWRWLGENPRPLLSFWFGPGWRGPCDQARNRSWHVELEEARKRREQRAS